MEDFEKYDRIRHQYAFKEETEYTIGDTCSGGRLEGGAKFCVVEIPEGNMIIEDGEVIGFIYGSDVRKYEHLYEGFDDKFYINERRQFRQLGGYDDGIRSETFSVALVNKEEEEARKKAFEVKLNELSVEEAVEKGIITNDSWNDEAWDVQMPRWRQALELAEKYHKEAGNIFTDKTRELRRGTDKPYVVFIQKLLYILINEVHFQSDDVLTVAALYNILNMTDCDRAVLVQEFGEEIVGQVELLQAGVGETFGEQLTRLVFMDKQKGELPTYVLLAAKLLEKRIIDRCPLEDWTEDVPYYKNLTRQLQECGLRHYHEKKWDRAVFLSEKILEQLDKNMDLSRNCNKTVEELYAGWDD